MPALRHRTCCSRSACGFRFVQRISRSRPGMAGATSGRLPARGQALAFAIALALMIAPGAIGATFAEPAPAQSVVAPAAIDVPRAPDAAVPAVADPPKDVLSGGAGSAINPHA